VEWEEYPGRMEYDGGCRIDGNTRAFALMFSPHASLFFLSRSTQLYWTHTFPRPHAPSPR